MSIIKPKMLKPGNTIGVIAPASPRAQDITEKYCKMLSSCGYNVLLGESSLASNGYLAGSDKVRANDLMNMFENPEVNAVFCLRGGYGCTRILEMIDFEIIKNNPKIFLGFSDITALHNSINRFCKLVTFHGPSVTNCQWGSYDFRFRECIRVLSGGNSYLKWKHEYNYKPVRGIICGGNLTLVESLIGTAYEVDVSDKILLLEDVGEKNYSIDRRLNHLKMAGYFDKCRAVIFGQFTEGDDHIQDGNISVGQIIEDIVVPCGKPIMTGAMFGHIINNPTIPMGIAGYIKNHVLYTSSAVNAD
ncbi:MAG: LD-carboxypeptidase [Ruminococcaceae bacterium]|nr:LD-carboxypeptidase [Oscillospiraceae bacterium]